MEKGKNGKILVIVLSVILFLSILAAAGLGIYHTVVEKRLEGCRILADFLRQEETELEAEASADLAGVQFSGKLPVFLRKTQAGSFLGVIWENQRLYLRENVFYLDNGRAFRVSAQLPQGQALLEQAQLVLSASRVTRERLGDLTVYRAEAGIDQAKAILKYLSPQTAEKMSVIDSLAITLTAKDGTLQSLALNAAGSDGTSPYRLELTLRVLEKGALDTSIPQAVLAAAENPGDVLTLKWDPNALPLLRGVLALAAGNDFQAELGFQLDCGILSFADSLDLRYNSGSRPGIGRLAGERLEFYFSGSKLCTAGGKLLTEYEEIRFDRLVALSLPVLVEGKVESLRTGDNGIYTMPLTQEELDMIAAAAASRAAGLTIRLTEGTLEARVTENRLTVVSFSCKGTVPVLGANIPAGVTVTLRPAEKPQALVIPDAVRAALAGENG